MPSISNFRQSRSLPSAAIAASTISILHDHDKLMRTQPLVGQIEALSSPPERADPSERTPEYQWFRQTEFVPFLPFGIWKKKIVFENWFVDLPDTPVPSEEVPTAGESSNEGGVRSKVYAPALTITAVFKVEKRKSDFSKDTINSRAENEKLEGSDSGWQLVEESEMVCKNAFVKWLSEGQHRKAHKQMLDSILHEAKKRAYVQNGESVA